MAGTSSAQDANFLREKEAISATSAAHSTTLPEMKKFAPTTPLKPISAVAISTAELTYR